MLRAPKRMRTLICNAKPTYNNDVSPTIDTDTPRQEAARTRVLALLVSQVTLSGAVSELGDTQRSGVIAQQLGKADDDDADGACMQCKMKQLPDVYLSASSNESQRCSLSSLLGDLHTPSAHGQGCGVSDPLHHQQPSPTHLVAA